MIEQLLQHPMSEQLGSVLLHSLWQGLVLWLVLLLALRLIPISRYSLRHAVATMVLFVWLAAPVLTLVSLRPLTTQLQNSAINGVTMQPDTVTGDFVPPDPTQHETEFLAIAAAPTDQEREPRPGGYSLLPLLALVWIAGASLLSIRYLGGLLSIGRLKRTARPANEHAVRFRRLAERMGVNRSVLLLKSARIDTPAAFGLIRPVVLLPLTAASGLTAMQLELILAHELAHIKRHDYLISIVQGLAEALLFYHPLTWTLSRVLLREREHACDELALQITGAQPIELARTLTQLESARLAAPALAATGNLKARVQRLLEVSANRPATGGASVLMLVAVIVGLIGFAALTPAQANEQFNATVVIDPAHSVASPGVTGHGVDEAELNLLIARRVAEKLSGAGVQVLLTREDSRALADTPEDDLAFRASVADGADLLVSLHAGAANSETVSGVRSYVTANAHTEVSRQLAEAVQLQLNRATGAAAAAVFDQPGNRLLELVEIPAIMLEYGYLSNRLESERLEVAAYQEQVAAGIAAGILNYLVQPDLFARSPAFVVAPQRPEVPEGGWPTFSSLAQLEQAAGAFKVPVRLPEGYYFSNAVITPETGSLYVTWTSRLRTDPEGAPEQVIGFSQTPRSRFTPLHISIDAPVLDVSVGELPAYFVPGGWRSTADGQEWANGGGSLTWIQDDLVMQVGMNGDASSDVVLDNLLLAAESTLFIDSEQDELPAPAAVTEPPSYHWVTLVGPATFGQPDLGITSLSEGGRLVLEERVPDYHRRLIITTSADGSLHYSYLEDGQEQPVDAGVEVWMRTLLTDEVLAALQAAVDRPGLQSARRDFGPPSIQLGMHFVRTLPSGWPFLHLAPSDSIGTTRHDAWTLDALVQARAHGLIGDGLLVYLLWEFRQYGHLELIDSEMLDYALAFVGEDEARRELMAVFADW